MDIRVTPARWQGHSPAAVGLCILPRVGWDEVNAVGFLELLSALWGQIMLGLSLKVTAF